MHVVIQDFPRPDPATVARFRDFNVATIHEAQGRTGLMSPAMRPVSTGTMVAGPAITVSVPPGDNWMIHVAMEQCQKGDVMVVAPTSACGDGYFGDLLATLAVARGVEALIIDAGVRDVADLRRMSFPAWSTSISAQGSVKETLGDVNIPIVCAGQLVNPGDIVIADDDGVVIVPRADAAEVLRKSAQREEKETAIRARYGKGELGLDINSMRGPLAAKGLVYLDAPEQK